MDHRHFVTSGETLDSSEFWYEDEAAWRSWLNEIEGAIREHDPWALLVMRPDCDQILVDVLDGWRDRIKRFNGRTVRLVQPDGWES